MLEIPGEEAPTDPGLVARQKLEAEARLKAASQRKKQRIVGAVAFVALLGAGLGGWQYWEAHKVASIIEFDDYYEVPLEELAAAPTPVADPAATARPAADATKPTASSGSRRPSTVPTGASAAPADPAVAQVADGPRRSTASGGVGETGPVGMASSLGSGGSAFGGVAIQVSQVGAEVLSDPQAIYDMAKRVINAMSPQVQTCYTQRLKQNESLKGAWEVGFTINKDGTTKVNRVKGLNTSDGELEACISRQIAGWKFQRISDEQPVKRTYRFGPTG